MGAVRCVVRLVRARWPLAQQQRRKSLSMSNMNPCVIKLEYAVRGPLVARATALQQELDKGASKPFKQVIRANLGDAHAMGQKPITWIRQVLACCSEPSLIKDTKYPEDVRARASAILGGCAGGSVGSYSASFGIDLIRKNVAAYISKRDGHPSDFNNIVLSTGATSGIKSLLELYANTPGKQSGVMVPIPQYPLYSATIAEYGMELVSYYLNEEANWGVDGAELERSFKEGSKRCDVRCIVVINPGNPTGQVLTRGDIEMVLEFAKKKNMLVIADEVYQSNVYDKNSTFVSFKKVLMESSHKGDLEVVSFMSASKGYSGECGLRAGWMEVVNMDPKVQADFYKMISATLCPSVLGQASLDCIAKPPASGEPSYDLWHKEVSGVLGLLAKRADMAVKAFNAMPGFKCNTVQGAMYAFPRFELPPKAIEAAKKENKKPDVFYAFRLLEETGICIVAGSGFGQKPGTWHFRTTILPQPALLAKMLDSFTSFHNKFTKEFS